jgi:arylsulfatase A-like enzyme
VQKLNPEAVTSPEVTRRALGLLAPRRDQPFFMFVHYFDPHYEYKAHPEFHFADPSGDLSLPRRLNVLRHPQTEVSPQDLAQLKARYAEEIAFTDQHLGRLLAYLDEHHLWDSTCVVFVADHGDEFLEHGSFEHGHTVFEELVHVPLFVSDPSRRAAAVAEQVVETRWLFGTVLDMLGVRRSASQGTTHNVFSAPQDREYYARSSIYGHQSCLIGDQYKVIDGPSKRMQTLPTARSGPAGSVRTIRQTGTESSNKLMLFDLLQDPGESRDLSRDLPEVSHRLRSTLAKLNEELSRRGEKVTMPRLTEQQRRVLKNLGYL